MIMAEDTTTDMLYQERIEAISRKAESTSIVNARSEFNDFLQNFMKTVKSKDIDSIEHTETSPKSIDELIKNYTDRFERLKFLFLEQEAKEQFFRLILDPDLKIIDREEILKSVEKCEDLKRQLQEKKEAIDSLTNDISVKANASNGFYEDILFKKDNLLSLLDEILEKNKYLDEIYEELNSFNSKDPSLKQFNTLKDGGNLNADFNIEDLNNQQLAEKLNEIKQKRKLTRDKLEELETIKASKISKMLKDEKRSNDLIAKNEKLDKLIDEIKKNENTNNENETKKREIEKILDEELKVNTLIEIMKKLSNISSFKFDNNENVISYKLMKFDHDECHIKINQSGKLQEIKYSLINEEKLNSILETSNKAKNPLLEATNSIYESLK